MKNFNFFKGALSGRAKKYQNTRAKRLPQRNSVFSLISDYIENNTIKSTKSPFRKNQLIDEGLYFQIFGMCILTVAVVLSFQAFVSSDSLSTNAEQIKDQDVRLLTNFQYRPEQETKQSRLQDFSSTPVVVPAQASADTKDDEVTLPKNESLPVSHEVTDGESVYSIAADYDVSPKDIISNNDLIEPYDISIGQLLKIN